MAKKPPATTEDLIGDLAAAIPFGLNKLARRGMTSELARTDPDLLNALWQLRDDYRHEFPKETLTPMVGASVLSSILRAGIDDDVRPPPIIGMARRSKRLPLLLLLAALGAAGFIAYKKLVQGKEPSPTDWSADVEPAASPALASRRPPIDDDTPISLA